MKFDIAIMNPPFRRNLHLKIVEKVIPHCEEVINISPIRWLQDPLAKYKKNSDYNKFRHSVAEHISDIFIINYFNSNELFEIRLSTDIAIIKCDKNVYSCYKLFENELIDRIKSKWKNANIEIDKKDGWRVKVSQICPIKEQSNRKFEDIKLLGKLLCFFDGEKDDKKWYTYWRANQYSKFTDELPYSIKFCTEIEANNFIKQFDTDFVKWFGLMTMIDVHFKENKLLWMGDYSQPWTDERFREYYEITDEEWKQIEDFKKQWDENRKI